MNTKTLKVLVLGAVLIGTTAALSACGGDGYTRSSYGMSFSTYDSGFANARDIDGDGIPNRYDLDRDGDGVSNRFDWAPNNPYRR